MKSYIFGADDTGPSVSGTQYAFVHIHNIGPGWNNTEGLRTTVIPHALTLDRFRMTIDTAPGAGKSYTFTIMKNGAATGLTLTISDAATAGQDLSNSVSFSAGDTISIRSVPSGTPAAFSFWRSNVRQDATQLQAVLGGAAGNVSNSAVRYNGLMSAATPVTTEQPIISVVPTGGTFKNLFVFSQTDPGAGTSYTVALMVNGSPTALSAAISGTNTTANDTSDSISVSAGDTVSMRITPSGTPTTTNIRYGLSFQPTNDGESILLYGDNANPSVSATNYEQPLGRGYNSWTATENNVRIGMGATTIKAMYVLLEFAPGSGKNYVFTLRHNGADSSATATVSDVATTANITGLSISVSDDDTLGLKSVPSGTPSATGVKTGILLSDGTSSTTTSTSLSTSTSISTTSVSTSTTISFTTSTSSTSTSVSTSSTSSSTSISTSSTSTSTSVSTSSTSSSASTSMSTSTTNSITTSTSSTSSSISISVSTSSTSRSTSTSISTSSTSTSISTSTSSTSSSTSTSQSTSISQSFTTSTSSTSSSISTSTSSTSLSVSTSSTSTSRSTSTSSTSVSTSISTSSTSTSVSTSTSISTTSVSISTSISTSSTSRSISTSSTSSSTSTSKSTSTSSTSRSTSSSISTSTTLSTTTSTSSTSSSTSSTSSSISTSTTMISIDIPYGFITPFTHLRSRHIW